MSIAIYEGVVEQRQVRFNEKATLPEGTRLYVIIPTFEASERQHLLVAKSLNSLNFYRDKTFETFKLLLPGLTQNERGCLQAAYELAKTFANDPADWLLFCSGHDTRPTPPKPARAARGKR